MKHKSCFTCGHCCTDACPNIQYDACEQYWGYGIAYHDDSQIVTLAVGKWYTPDEPCVIVKIKEV